jgi:TonB family protein
VDAAGDLATEKNAPFEFATTPSITAPPAPAPKEEDVHAALPVGADVKEARLLSSVLPEYPLAARQGHVEGDVVVRMVVDKGGNVSDMKVVSGPLILRQAALVALHHWKYEPSTVDGHPIPVQVSVKISFRL